MPFFFMDVMTLCKNCIDVVSSDPIICFIKIIAKVTILQIINALNYAKKITNP